jgi:CRP-like cAMP-binding protein
MSQAAHEPPGSCRVACCWPNPQRTLPKISQETLAEILGATRSRVNFFMNKFRKLGLIEYNGGLKINRSLLSVVLHD